MAVPDDIPLFRRVWLNPSSVPEACGGEDNAHQNHQPQGGWEEPVARRPSNSRLIFEEAAVDAFLG